MSIDHSQQHVKPVAVNWRGVSKMLGISRTKIFAMMTSGELHGFKLGGKLLFKIAEVERLVAESPPARPVKAQEPHRAFGC